MKKTTLKTLKLKWLLWLALIFLVKLPVRAQIVTGKILAENQEQLQGATVRADSRDQKDNFTSMTNEKGVFVFRQLRPGVAYKFTASYVGYEENTISSFTVKQG